MMSDLYRKCQKINELLESGREEIARNELIALLDEFKNTNFANNKLVNHLLRRVGLYNYMSADAIWSDKMVRFAFMADAGNGNLSVMHREQSYVLKMLETQNIILSAPTSFGKSYIIDSYIARNRPKVVMIIVPTIALADECRRRLQCKFSDYYKIVTTTHETIDLEPVIFIFPQERAIHYARLNTSIDFFVVDEFYKAGAVYDERASTLQHAILLLSKKSKRKYYIAPNIKLCPEDFLLTKNMNFLSSNYNTVVVREIDRYTTHKKQKKEENVEKLERLNNVLKETKGEKTLIYVGSKAQMREVNNFLYNNMPILNNELLCDFSEWIKNAYSDKYSLHKLILKGVGIHSGVLHRSLAQYMIKIFSDHKSALRIMVSTSSMIEGVNTAAENIVLYSKKIGIKNLDLHTYKNIKGRAGRMDQYYIGKIYLLEKPVVNDDDSICDLNLQLTEEALNSIPEDELPDLSEEEYSKRKEIHAEMDQKLGKGGYRELISSLEISLKTQVLKGMIKSISAKPKIWKGLASLNMPPNCWNVNVIYELLTFSKSNYKKTHVVDFMKLLYYNWDKSYAELENIYSQHNSEGIGFDEKFFDMERYITFSVYSHLDCAVKIYNKVYEEYVDISSFLSKLKCAFLPRIVYELEEFGLPRMISKKLANSPIFDFLNDDISASIALQKFRAIGKKQLYEVLGDCLPFERYIIDYFYEGI